RLLGNKPLQNLRSWTRSEAKNQACIRHHLLRAQPEPKSKKHRTSMFDSEDLHQIPPRAAMKNITSPGLIKLKGILFLIIGLFASVFLFLQQPRLKVAVLVVI